MPSCTNGGIELSQRANGLQPVQCLSGQSPPPTVSISADFYQRRSKRSAKSTDTSTSTITRSFAVGKLRESQPNPGSVFWCAKFTLFVNSRTFSTFHIANGRTARVRVSAWGNFHRRKGSERFCPTLAVGICLTEFDSQGGRKACL